MARSKHRRKGVNRDKRKPKHPPVRRVFVPGMESMFAPISLAELLALKAKLKARQSEDDTIYASAASNEQTTLSKLINGDDSARVTDGK